MMHGTFRTFNGQSNGKPSQTSQLCSVLALSTLLWVGVPQGVIRAQEVEASTANQSRFWDFNGQTNQLRLTLDSGVAPRYFLLARPMRIAIEFPAPEAVSPESFQYSSGAVEQLIVSPQGNGNLRLILQLRSGVELQPKQVALQQIDSHRWLITPLLVGATDSPPLPVAPSALTNLSLTDLSTGVSSGTNSGISSGVDSILEPRVGQVLPPVTASPVTATPPTPAIVGSNLTPDRTVSTPSLIPQPRSLRPEAENNSWPTQVIELRPQRIVETPAPTAQPPRSNPSASDRSAVSTAIPSIPTSTQSFTSTPETIVSVPTSSAISSSVASSSVASSSAISSSVQSSAAEKPAVLATRPLVERRETIAPLASMTAPAIPTASLTHLEFGQPLPITSARNTDRNGSPNGSLNNSTPSATSQTSKPKPPELPQVTLPLVATTISGSVPGSVAGSVPQISGELPISLEAQYSTSRILLAKGSPIPLRYTGTVPLEVAARENRQEVLIVDEDVKSPQGQVVIPGGSQVIGRFETNWRGSRFIAQAISFGTYNQSFEAQSQRLSGDRLPNPLSIGAGSGTGAIAGTLIAGGFGALGGAALGAVSGYFVSPPSTTLEPHQILMVYLAEDWVAN